MLVPRRCAIRFCHCLVVLSLLGGGTVIADETDQQAALELNAEVAYQLALSRSADYLSLIDDLDQVVRKIRPESVGESTPAEILGIARDLAQSMTTEEASRYRSAGSIQIRNDLSVDHRELLHHLRKVERYRLTLFLRTMAGPTTDRNRSTGLGGYYGLLQRQLAVRHQRARVVALHQNLSAVEDTLVESLITIPDDAASIVGQRIRVTSARQSLLESEAELLREQSDYQDAVDQFKTTLGIPLAQRVKIESALLNRLNLVTPELLSLQEETARLFEPIEAANIGILESVKFRPDSNTGQLVPAISWDGDLESMLTRLQASIDPLQRVVRNVLERHLLDVQADIEAAQQALPQRAEDLAAFAQACDAYRDSVTGDGGLDPNQTSWVDRVQSKLIDGARTESSLQDLVMQSKQLDRRMQSYNRQLDQVGNQIKSLLAKKPEGPTFVRTLRDRVILGTQDVATELSEDLTNLTLLQAHARAHSLRVAPVVLTWQSALPIASRHRWDWMGARAQLVDATLGSGLSEPQQRVELTFTAGSSPLQQDPESATALGDLAGGDALLKLGSAAPDNAPQLAGYRTAMRQYDAFVAGISTELRSILRDLRDNQIAFELHRSNALLAIRQNQLADDAKQLRIARGQTVDQNDRHEAMTALADLRSAERKMIKLWLDHQVQRANLDLNLGTLSFDEQGSWIDPGDFGEKFESQQLQGSVEDPEFIVQAEATAANP